MDFRLHGGPSLLLRQAGDRDHLVFHLGLVGDWLADRLVPDPSDGSGSGHTLPPGPNGLQRGLDSADFPGDFRGAPDVSGQVDQRDHLLADGRVVSDRGVV
ncbi:hypothetical protein D9M71_693000 [compost metagenome]